MAPAVEAAEQAEARRALLPRLGVGRVVEREQRVRAVLLDERFQGGQLAAGRVDRRFEDRRPADEAGRLPDLDLRAFGLSGGDPGVAAEDDRCHGRGGKDGARHLSSRARRRLPAAPAAGAPLTRAVPNC